MLWIVSKASRFGDTTLQRGVHVISLDVFQFDDDSAFAGPE